MDNDVLISFVLATHNRAKTLLHTLSRVKACGLPRRRYEIFVVDNASCDGTADVLARHHADVKVISETRNFGSCAKALAVPHAQGHTVVFLDDDSFPLDDSAEQMIEHFQSDPSLGAAGFVTHLAGGGQECSALPNVFIGCGVGFRREALLAAGNLDVTYFMQAEEYDLSFRLIQAGYKVKTFEDLHVLHLKTPVERRPARQVYYDVRNNFTLALSFLPRPWLREYLDDWAWRYRRLAEEAGALEAFEDGRLAGLMRGWQRRLGDHHSCLDAAAMNQLFGTETIARGMSDLKAEGYRSVLFADLGKNIYPYYRAAADHSVNIRAVMDDRFAGDGQSYREIPITTYDKGLSVPADAIVISNSSPVHAQRTRRRLRKITPLPVYLWHGSWSSASTAMELPSTRP